MSYLLTDLSLRPTYNSYEVDTVGTFFIPVLTESVEYDRATAYFSAKALSRYAQGLEVFARRPNSLYRLIISTEVTEEDYEEIKKGYAIRSEIVTDMVSKLREDISLSEKKNISDMAQLISLGVLDIKMAFTRQGIFHDKFGIVRDERGNEITFRGSNNETKAALDHNFDSFEISCSWKSSDFDREKIVKCKEMFEELWGGVFEGVVVRDMDDVIKQEILKFDNGRARISRGDPEPDVALQKDDEAFFLSASADLLNDLTRTPFYKVRLKHYVQHVEGDRMTFIDNISLTQIKRIEGLLAEDSEKRGYTFGTSSNVVEHMDMYESKIREHSKVGTEIKARDVKLIPRFKEFEEIVNAKMVRKLKERQMWDSFFMCAMWRSGNFSVPGSGKTASVLGSYAYLKAVGQVSKIVMIGPKNSFSSWTYEFKECFGEKEDLRCFDCHDPRISDKRGYLKLNSGDRNLLLFNYESLGTYEDILVEHIIDENTLLVFDEVHRIKNASGVRARHALNVSKNAVYVATLTGTPIPNSYSDIYNVLRILFGNDYQEFFGFDPSELSVLSDKMMSNVNKKLYPFFCRTTKAHLAVPAPNKDIIEEVPASDIENRAFRIIVGKYRESHLALMVRILQLESDPKMLLNRVDITELDELDMLASEEELENIEPLDGIEGIDATHVTVKTKRCISLVRSLVEEGKKVLIWCIFKGTIRNLEALLSKEVDSVRIIYGDTEIQERQKILDDFRAGKVDVLITNPHTLAESISLHQICHDAVYFEYSYNLVHLLQSKDRINRLGLKQDQYTQYYFLQTLFNLENGYSLGEEIYKRLCLKEEIMLNAIERGTIEVLPSSEEDLNAVFEKLNL